MKNEELTRHIGYDLLGPVVHRWLLALDQYISFFDDGNTKFLYTARAGVRIKALYEQYLEGSGRAPIDAGEMFWVSRLALCKGLYNAVPDLCANVIASEYRGKEIRDIAQGLLRNRIADSVRLDFTAKDLDAHSPSFSGWLRSSFPIAKFTTQYLQQSGEAFETYTNDLLGGRARAVLIDSGWQGTGQSLLSHARKDIDWKGLYIGRILTPAHDKKILDKVIGLLFQANEVDPQKPETAITMHRHLFESLLEPNAPSIEEVVGGPCDEIALTQILANENDNADQDHDALYRYVQEYLKNHAGIGPASILARHQAAMPLLARMILEPSEDEALALSGKDRSADFGKEITVPVLIRSDQGENGHASDIDRRIQTALWPQGQIALEHKGRMRQDLQRRASGFTSDQSYFDPTAHIEVESAATYEVPSKPTVAIITRTKNRPLLLKRAAESVAKQTYQSFLWVIVNDGGDEEAVCEVVADCSVDRRKIRLVSNPDSLGMEAASNAGIQHIDSDYILIHDDDDSLHARFLEETIQYLESNAGRRYGGVVTGTEYVSEEIRGNEVIEHDRYPFIGWIRNIQLAELMCQNLFAPISFVYRREIYERIGGYNPELPVLGDWYFNLEFVLNTDIKVMPKTLAYYHHRDKGDSSRTGVYSNSVIGGQSKHEEFASIARNMLMRKYGENNAVAAGLSGSYYAMDLRNRIASSSFVGTSKEHDESEIIGRGAGTKEAQAVFRELDRLWLLSAIHSSRPSLRGLFLGKSVPGSDSTMEELSSYVIQRRIGVDAPPSFDEALYLKNNGDVDEAVKSGRINSGYQHYIMFGAKEGRPRTTKRKW